MLVVIGMLIFIVTLGIIESNSQSSKIKELEESYNHDSLEAGGINTKDSIAPLDFPWNKEESTDPMTDKKTTFAWLRSMNSINLSFPYEGDTYLKMTIRKKDKTNVYFQIDRGQILCNEYSGTNFVYIRFDKDDPIKYKTIEASSGRSDIIFLSGNEKSFINRCKKAKEIKVQIPIYDFGNAVFNYIVTKPLEWP